MIDMSKKYRYRNGEPARVLCVDAESGGELAERPVLSIGPNVALTRHYQNGKTHEASDEPGDLIEVLPETVEWCGVFDCGNASQFLSSRTAIQPTFSSLLVYWLKRTTRNGGADPVRDVTVEVVAP